MRIQYFVFLRMLLLLYFLLLLMLLFVRCCVDTFETETTQRSNSTYLQTKQQQNMLFFVYKLCILFFYSELLPRHTPTPLVLYLYFLPFLCNAFMFAVWCLRMGSFWNGAQGGIKSVVTNKRKTKL